MNESKHFYLFLSIYLSLFLLSGSMFKASADWYLDQYGRLSNDEQGFVLGEESSESEDSEELESEESDETDEVDEVDEIDEVDEVDDEEQEMELVTEENGIKTKIKLESRDGKLIIKREVESDDDEYEYEEELGEQGIFEIQERVNKRTTKVATGSGEYKLIIRTRTAARTNFPLSINTETNELIVTTPAGTKVVTVLPDQAVANMLAQNVIDRVADDDIESEEATSEDIDSYVELTDEEGTLAYEIEGESDQKALGVFDVKIKKTVKVSAETGEIISQDLSLYNQFLDFISF